MATKVSVTLSDLLKHYGLDKDNLDTEIAEDCFFEISRSLSDWKLLALLTEEEVEAIENDNRTEELKRKAFLKKLKQKSSIKATYRVLVDALLRIERGEDARKLCELLKPKVAGAVVPVSPSVLTSLSAIQSPSRSEYFQLESEIKKLVERFENIVEAFEESLIENNVSVKKLRRSIKHMPVSLKLQLGEYFCKQTFEIFRAESIEQLIALLSYFWDYLNPGLLEFFVGRFGSDNDINSIEDYVKELQNFRSRVKLGEYVRACPTMSHTYKRNFYKQIVTIMGEDWEKETLQDAEDYRIELSEKLHFQAFIPRIDVKSSSIAIVFSIPRGIQINFVELEPFFHYKNVSKVYLDGVCLIDWIKKPYTGPTYIPPSHGYLQPFQQPPQRCILPPLAYIPHPSSSIRQLKELRVKALIGRRTLIEKQVMLNLNRTHVPSESEEIHVALDEKTRERIITGKTPKMIRIINKMNEEMKVKAGLQQHSFSRSIIRRTSHELYDLSREYTKLKSNEIKQNITEYDELISKLIESIKRIQEYVIGLFEEQIAISKRRQLYRDRDFIRMKRQRVVKERARLRVEHYKIDCLKEGKSMSKSVLKKLSDNKIEELQWSEELSYYLFRKMEIYIMENEMMETRQAAFMEEILQELSDIKKEKHKVTEEKISQMEIIIFYQEDLIEELYQLAEELVTFCIMEEDPSHYYHIMLEIRHELFSSQEPLEVVEWSIKEMDVLEEFIALLQ